MFKINFYKHGEAGPHHLIFDLAEEDRVRNIAEQLACCKSVRLVELTNEANDMLLIIEARNK